MKIATLIALAVLIMPSMAQAHGGGLDGSGGHNCNVGACAGTYHYHHGGDKTVEYSYPEGSSPTPAPSPQPAPTPVVTTKNETSTETIAFTSSEQEDPELPKGERKLIQEGQDGEKTITYKVTYTDGAETNRERTGEEITTQPVNEIYAVGTKEEQPEQPEEQNSEEESSETEEASPAETAVGLAVMGGGGYYAYKKIKGRKK